MLAVGMFLVAVTAQSSEIRYSLIMRGTCKSMGESGEIVTSRHTTATILAECAAKQEPPLNPKDLALVYDVYEGTSYIVDKATGEEVCEYFDLETRSALGNQSGTKWEMLTSVNDQSAEDEDGGALISLTVNFDTSGDISRFRIAGRYHLVYRDEITGDAIVCGGNIATGRLFTPGTRR